MFFVHNRLKFVMNQKLQIMLKKGKNIGLFSGKKIIFGFLIILFTSAIFINLTTSKKMREIKTEITINAPKEVVWKTFSNFENYGKWNPFIESIIGEIKVGEQIKIRLTPPDAKAMTFKPKVLVFEENKEFRWLGNLFFKGIFDGEHYFQLIDNQDGTTTFVHGEKFKGILVGSMGSILENTKKGFEMMNEALKKEVEKTKV
jgi:hypothetical protein